VLKHFFTKQKLSRREARWLETLGNFGIFPVTLKPGRIHVLGDVLSRAPHVTEVNKKSLISFNALDIPKIEFEAILGNYENDQFFGPIVKALEGAESSNGKQNEFIKRVLPMFERDGARLLYQGKLCVPRRAVSSILHMAHDSKIAGHFGFSKTMSRLENYHWRHKGRDVKKYVQGCLTCQQKKDHSGKKLTDPTSLEVPERRWGSLATDFIVSLPKTKLGYDCITTWVDRLSRRVHFIPSKMSDTAVDVADSFYTHVFKHHGMPDIIVSDRDPKFTSKFWDRLMELFGVKLKMSSSRHPQTDGASEVMNRMVENYLRCYCSYHQDDWDTLLPSAEFAYNSAISADLGSSPFEVDLGYNPSTPLHKSVPVETVEEFKRRLRETLDDARYSYQVAKARQCANTAGSYKPHDYQVGDKLWITKNAFH